METVRQTAMQAGQVEKVDLLSTANDQPFDQVSTVEFHLSSGHARQIPALRRWRPTDPPATVECTASRQDPTNRPQRWNLLQRVLPRMLGQLSPNRDGSKLAQRTARFQPATNIQDQVFD